jgi:hypothetical protein
MSAVEATADGESGRSANDAVDGSSSRHASATDSGADKAPTNWRSYLCR